MIYPNLTQMKVIDETLKRRFFEERLIDFVYGVWNILEPATDYKDNWHIKVICDHLEACSRGEIRNLIINIPPRCMKSLLVSVIWPVWEWLRYPSSRFMFVTYSHTLAKRDSRKRRDIIRSQWFQKRWGDKIVMVSDSDTTTRYDNDQTGFMFSTSVQSTATGEGGDWNIIDDFHSADDAQSDVKRASDLEWYKSTMPSRLNRQDYGGRIVIGQRLHEDDLPGYLISEHHEKWERLILPWEYEPENKCHTSIGFEDPRKEPGELLWESRKEIIEEPMEYLGSYGIAGQYQQRPAPKGGGMIKADCIKLAPTIESIGSEVVLRCRSWDKAGTQDGGAYTVGILLAKLKNGLIVIEDEVRGQWSYMQREENIKRTAELDGQSVIIDLEQEPGSGGKESAEATVKNLMGYIVRMNKVTGSKEVRAQPFSVYVEKGFVYCLNRPWTIDYLRELASFPTGTYKDRVDATTGAFNQIALSYSAPVKKMKSESIRKSVTGGINNIKSSW